MNELPHFNLTVGELDDEENIYATSLVSSPATSKMIQAFSDEQKESKIVKFAQMQGTDEFERIISGVWMIPDVKYYRIHNGFEFTVSLSRQELKKALVQFLKNDSADNFDIEHDGSFIDGLVSIEHWIIEDKNTRSPVMGYTLADLGYTFEEIPVGTVMKTVFIKDKQFFEDMILSGDVMGYSLEGFFNLSQETINTMEGNTQKFTKVGQMFNELGIEQHTGTVITTEGSLVISENGIMLNDVKITEGEYKTKAMFSIVIREGSVVDFGFEEQGQGTVAVESVTPTVEVQPTAQTTVSEIQPTPEAVVTAPETTVVPEVTPNTVDTQLENDKQSELIKSIVAQQLESVKADLTSKDILIKELQDKLSSEINAKEVAIQASTIPTVKKDNKPDNYSPDKFTIRKKGGQTYYIPKR